MFVAFWICLSSLLTCERASFVDHNGKNCMVALSLSTSCKILLSLDCVFKGFDVLIKSLTLV